MGKLANFDKRLTLNGEVRLQKIFLPSINRLSPHEKEIKK